MKKFRMIATDLDGTALPGRRLPPSERLLAILEKLTGQGVLFVPVTGRPLYGIPENLLVFPGLRYLIHSNGAAVTDRQSGELLYQNPVPVRPAVKILEFLEQYPESLKEVFFRGKILLEEKQAAHLEEYYFPPHHRNGWTAGGSLTVPDFAEWFRTEQPDAEELVITDIVPEGRARLLDLLDSLGTVHALASGASFVEMSAFSTNKGAAVSFLARKLGIGPEEILTFGDNQNDIELLMTGIGLAVANATPEARAAACGCTLANTADGLAFALENLFQNGCF